MDCDYFYSLKNLRVKSVSSWSVYLSNLLGWLCSWSLLVGPWLCLLKHIFDENSLSPVMLVFTFPLFVVTDHQIWSTVSCLCEVLWFLLFVFAYHNWNPISWCLCEAFCYFLFVFLYHQIWNTISWCFWEVLCFVYNMLIYDETWHKKMVFSDVVHIRSVVTSAEEPRNNFKEAVCSSLASCDTRHCFLQPVLQMVTHKNWVLNWK